MGSMRRAVVRIVFRSRLSLTRVGFVPAARLLIVVVASKELWLWGIIFDGGEEILVGLASGDIFEDTPCTAKFFTNGAYALMADGAADIMVKLKGVLNADKVAVSYFFLLRN